jgi:molybdopterin converting factor small subunit
MVTKTSEIRVPLSGESSVEEVITHISERYPGLRLCEGRVLVLVNSEIASMSRVLSPNDKVTFLPPLGGG